MFVNCESIGVEVEYNSLSPDIWWNILFSIGISLVIPMLDITLTSQMDILTRCLLLREIQVKKLP